MAISEDLREIEVLEGDDVEASAIGIQMRVAKRDGSLEPVDLNKIVRAVARCAAGLENVDAMRVATRTISGLVDGATTEELDNLSIRTAAAFIAVGLTDNVRNTYRKKEKATATTIRIICGFFFKRLDFVSVL